MQISGCEGPHRSHHFYFLCLRNHSPGAVAVCLPVSTCTNWGTTDTNADWETHRTHTQIVISEVQQIQVMTGSTQSLARADKLLEQVRQHLLAADPVPQSERTVGFAQFRV